MSTDVAVPADPMKAFQARVIDKLKADIGSMLPDEVLKGLSQKAVDDTFFKERVEGDSWNKRQRPSWFVEEISKLARPMLEAEVKRFVKENHEVIQKAVNSFLSQNNLMLVLMAQLREESAESLKHVQQAINDIEQKLQKLGQP